MEQLYAMMFARGYRDAASVLHLKYYNDEEIRLRLKAFKA